jgi:hypothetical protein
MKGKNFSANNVGGKRKKSDFYETPYSITKQLLEREELIGSILEPACGDGAILNLLPKNAIGYDKEKDFLTETDKYDTIITNPPFSIAYQFIQKAKQIANHKIIMLLPLSYLHGKKRHDDIWMDKQFPLEKVYVFTRYPLLGELLRVDGKYNTGMMVYAWYVWNKDYKGDAQINWIDNNEWILKK